MQSVGIYIAVLTCDFRRNDRKLGVATFIKMKNKVQSIGFESLRGHLWHLEGTTNSILGKKHSCSRYFKHKDY